MILTCSGGGSMKAYALVIFLVIAAFGNSSAFATTTSAEGQPGQIYSKDVIGWIVSFGATLPPALGLLYTAKQLKSESNARYIQAFAEIEKEISSIENNKDRSLASPARKTWEISFLNTMDKYAVLMQSKKYPKDLLDSFRVDFGYARYLVEKDDSQKGHYSEILKVCNKKQWPPFNADDR